MWFLWKNEFLKMRFLWKRDSKIVNFAKNVILKMWISLNRYVNFWIKCDFCHSVRFLKSCPTFCNTLYDMWKHLYVVILICLLAFYDALCWVLMDKKALVQRDDMLLKTDEKKQQLGTCLLFSKSHFLLLHLHTLNATLFENYSNCRISIFWHFPPIFVL